MKASDLFVRALENEGVKYVFGVPGEENLDLLESLRASNITLVLTRHEQGAGFMAATVGRLTGKPGVALSTLGPGATNLITAAAYAQLGGMPLVMITGQKPIKQSRQGLFQIVDVPRVMEPVTKFSRQIVHGNTIPARVREAFRVAGEERPGAVLLELPEDIADEDTESQLFTAHDPRRPAPDEQAVTDALKLIRQAKSPMLLIGAGANRKRVGRALTAFLDATGMPFFNTQMGKGVVNEDHPGFIGTAALSEGDWVHCAVDKADLIINIGHDTIEKPPFFMEHGGTEVIHVDFDSEQVDEVYFPQAEVLGDIARSVEALKQGLEKDMPKWDFSWFHRLKKKIDRQLAEEAESEAFPLLPQSVVHRVRTAMPDDGIVSLDNGMFKVWFARSYRAREHNTLLLDNALATMGAGLPAAVAAGMVYPDRRVLAVCGDGGFMMNSQELETAVRLGLDLTVIILNDGGYGMIKWKQQAEGYPDWGLDFGNPDFVKYAESYGAHGHRVETSRGFSDKLQDCLGTRGVHVIDVPVDYSQNQKMLVDDLKAKTCLV